MCDFKPGRIAGMKKRMVLIAAVLFLISIAAVATALEGNIYIIDMSSYDTFRAATYGNRYDVDNYMPDDPIQCYDAAGIVWRRLDRWLDSGNTHAAYGCWSVESARYKNAGSDFYLVYNLADVRRGDIVVLAKTSTSPYGHIGFADEDYGGSSALKIYSQNQNGRKEFNVYTNRNIRNVFLGAFRFKGWSSVDPSKPAGWVANGLYCDPSLGWVLMRNGEVAYGYSGLWNDASYGWWLIRNGRVAFDYAGLWNDRNYGWWLISGGQIAWNYTGIWNDRTYGSWLIGGGQVAFDYTGLWNDPNAGWWLIGGGKVAFDYTGLWNDPTYGWWLVDGGRVAFDYTGLWDDPTYGTWLIGGGQVAFDYTGIWADPHRGWWLIGGGALAADYNGLWNDPNYGWWLITNGAVYWGYYGTYEANGVEWTIEDGKLIF